jgi:hypothetical protein
MACLVYSESMRLGEPEPSHDPREQESEDDERSDNHAEGDEQDEIAMRKWRSVRGGTRNGKRGRE